MLRYLCRLGSTTTRSRICTKLENKPFKIQCIELCSKPKMNIVQFTPTSESFQIKNERRNRPMSPHLTIYAVQITSVCSITHRLTGAALAGYWIAMSLAALVLPNDLSNYIAMIEGLNLPSVVFILLKFIIAFPYGYHLSNGVRHLYWDTGR
ncbi:Succinate dehydrogenase cytochrome b560 subunit, mitochondrial, partial [Eumeta japonica]